MPVYEYECDKCNKTFIDIKPVSECKEPSPCECGGIGKRILSPVAVKSFIGSYQYDKINNYPPGSSATDYQNGKNATEDW